MKNSSPPPMAAEQLHDLLLHQRAALLRTDPGGIAELEARTREMEQAFAALAAGARSSPGSLAGLDATAIARLQAELQINQATLVNLASGNRRALNALFGEPDLYSK